MVPAEGKQGSPDLETIFITLHKSPGDRQIDKNVCTGDPGDMKSIDGGLPVWGETQSLSATPPGRVGRREPWSDEKNLTRQTGRVPRQKA